MAQHALILIAGLSALMLATLARETGERDGEMEACEEAMSWLRRRDQDRTQAFEVEKATLTSTLRDRTV